jgi:DNA replication and repair protein RecF
VSGAILSWPGPGQACAEGPARLAVTQLALTDFRCYRALRMEADERPVVLFGSNGAGKTNVLEAVSMLAPGRGLRGARLSDMARRDADAGAPWAVAATVATPRGEIRIGTALDPAGQGGEGGEGARAPGRIGTRRVVKIDGARAAGPSALAEVVQAVWLTPEMDRLFDRGPSARRRFLDRVVYGFDPGHAGRSSAYERAMRQRARLLRSGGGDPAWLGALEERMASDGVAIAAARGDVAARLGAACADGFGPFPGADLAVSGTLEDWLAEMPALQAEGRLRALLADARDQDAVTGGAADGPHRSDLLVRHREKGVPAERCSTGEQKALLIAIVLATASLRADELGAAPLVLLDEVAAHLDEVRRAALLQRLSALGAQAWVTGTDAALFDGLRGAAQFFHVAEATVTSTGGS